MVLLILYCEMITAISLVSIHHLIVDKKRKEKKIGNFNIVRSILCEMIKTPYFCFYTAASVNYTFTFSKLTSAFCNKVLLLYLQVGSKTENQ